MRKELVMFINEYSLREATRERTEGFLVEAQRDRKTTTPDHTESWRETQRDLIQREILQAVRVGEMGVEEGVLRLKGL
jgi:hypothetical protein